MTEATRIDVQDARRRAQNGQALLVCAYDDEAKCRSLALEGAITRAAFESRAGSLPRDQEIIFYCA